MEKYIGQLLDNRYEILEIIGVGGMAVVYKARCHRLNRFVAVKVLKEDFAEDDDFRRRFHDESQAVAMLSHPNIVAVYDVSRNQELDYIVMELIDGITLKQYMQKKVVLTWRESLHFVTQIVKALSHAHTRGIIHRDIKPHNIMILRDGSVKVADFGIARFTGKQHTLKQEALGSVHYISPEQARGSHIDARSDIYSVGVVLYEMLTGRLPYEGDSPVSVAIQHINSLPLSPKEINPDIPDALETITMKAMSASLSKRYTSAEVMLYDLDEFRKNPSISFDYDLSDSHAYDADEPTRSIPHEDINSADSDKVGQKTRDRPAGKASDRQKTEKQQRQRELLEEEKMRTRRNNTTVATLTGILGVLIFLGVLTFIVVQLIQSITNPPESNLIEVPQLQGRTYNADFEAWFGENYVDFELRKVESYSADRAKGVIIKQEPSAKEEWPSGTIITITVSLGPKSVQLPDFTNYEFRNVESELIMIGLRLGPVRRDLHDTVERDHVIYTDPPAWTVVDEGTFITIYVSNGKEAVRFMLQDYVGYMLSDAEKDLRDTHGMNVTVRYEEHPDAPFGQVIRQDILPFTEVLEGGDITLTVSSGPPYVEPSPSELPSEPPSIEPPTPSEPESPSPSEPSESPTPSESEPPPPPPPPLTVTNTFTVDLTAYTGTILIELCLDSTGELIWHTTLESDEFTVYSLQPMTGLEGTVYLLYIDNVLVNTYTLR
jgi:serine/threonine-protein kinase